jgi:adenylosuccinate lyase
MIERYLSKEMETIFSDESRFQAYLKVELLALEGWAQIGRIPQDDVALIEKNAKVDVKRIKELELVTKHDVVAFTRQVSQTLGEERRWIHYGLTSTDVVDTAMGLLYKTADDLIDADFKKILVSVKSKAIAFKEVCCIGRTHGMHAEITSFGLKWANYYDELLRGYARFTEARKDLESGKISGAVGNFANVQPTVQDYVCAKLGLTSAKVSTQVLSRDLHAYYGSVLAICGSTMEKIALEIRLLSQTEIGEVEEGFAAGQKGSSAMPQKRNPVSSENICGCARLLRGYMLPLLEDNALFHERDISHSSVERTALIDLIELFDYMLKRMKGIIDNLNVFPKRMEENITLSNHACFAQQVMTKLVEKGWAREKAYDLIQPLAMQATLGQGDFKKSVEENREIATFLTKEEMESIFDEKYALKNIDVIYRRVGLI